MQRSINYIHFDTVSSTNEWAKQQIHLLNLQELTCVTASQQIAGKGSRGRRWLSPIGNLYASFVFSLPSPFPHLHNLAQILSLSCIKMLTSHGFAPQIKWPNDILLEGKKVGGILCETVSLAQRIGVILGIGINVNMGQELLAKIDQPATSLEQLSGHTWDLQQILRPLLEQFSSDLELLEKEGFAPFQKAYEDHLACRGQTMTCEGVTGICRGVNEQGTLQLLLPSDQE